MKILFTRFPLESRFGGAEVQTLALWQGLMARGHAVAFLGSCPTLLKLCREHGIPAAELQIGPPPVTAWGAISFAWRKRRMKRALHAALAQFQDLDAACMLSLTEKLLMTDMLAARGAKVLWIEHDRIGRWLTRNPWLGLLRAQSAHATTVVVSRLSKRLYEAMGWPGPLVAIPNGIDPSRFKIPHSGFPKKSPLRIGCIARLSPEKGVDVLLEAIRDLPDVTLDIVGDGKDAKNLHALADRVAPNRVRFQPKTDDVGAFYASLDAFVLPSREHDPFGLAAAEAMLCGLPTVVTDACGIADELMDGEDALVVPANSSEALRQALQRLSDAALRTRLGTQAQRTARKKFSVDAMVEAYETLLKGKQSR